MCAPGSHPSVRLSTRRGGCHHPRRRPACKTQPGSPSVVPVHAKEGHARVYRSTKSKAPSAVSCNTLWEQTGRRSKFGRCRACACRATQCSPRVGLGASVRPAAEGAEGRALKKTPHRRRQAHRRGSDDGALRRWLGLGDAPVSPRPQTTESTVGTGHQGSSQHRTLVGLAAQVLIPTKKGSTGCPGTQKCAEHQHTHNVDATCPALRQGLPVKGGEAGQGSLRGVKGTPQRTLRRRGQALRVCVRRGVHEHITTSVSHGRFGIVQGNCCQARW